MKKLLRSIRGGSSKKDKSNEKEKIPKSSLQDGPNALHIAAESGDIDKAYDLVKIFGVNCVDSIQGQTSLHFAAAGGHLQMIKMLIDEGGDARIKSKSGQIPLFHAIERRNEECALWLISKGYATLDVDENESSLLHYAAYYGLSQSFRKIYTLHPELIDVPDGREMHPIHVAVDSHQEDIVNYILTVHPESCEAKTHGSTPLMLAVQNEDIEIIRILLEAGCKTNVCYHDGVSIETVAKEKRNEEISQLILLWAFQNNSPREDNKSSINVEAVNSTSENTFKNEPNSRPQSQNLFNKDKSVLPAESFLQINETTDVKEGKKSSSETVNSWKSEKDPHSDHTGESDWDSNSEHDDSRKGDSKTISNELRSRISQTFLLPATITEEKRSLIQPLEAGTDTRLTGTLVDGTLGREGTMKDSATTLVRNAIFLKRDCEADESDDVNIIETETGEHETQGIMNRKGSVIIMEETSQAIEIVQSKKKSNSIFSIPSPNFRLKKSSGNSLRPKSTMADAESDFSDWGSDSSEEDSSKSAKNKSADEERSDAGDRVSVQETKHPIPILETSSKLELKEKIPVGLSNKDKAGLSDHVNESGSNSSRDDASTTNMKNHNSTLNMKIASLFYVKNDENEIIDTTTEVISQVVHQSEDKKTQEMETFSVPKIVLKSRELSGNVDSDVEIDPKLESMWSGVMNELNKGFLSGKVCSKSETSINKENETDKESWSSSDSTKSEESTGVENVPEKSSVLPTESSLSAQTCKVTSSEVFGKIEATQSAKENYVDIHVQTLFKTDPLVSFKESNSSIDLNGSMIPVKSDIKATSKNNDAKSDNHEMQLLSASSMIPVLLGRIANTVQVKLEDKPNEPIPLSSLVIDDIDALKRKLSLNTSNTSELITKRKTTRKSSCPNPEVPKSFMGKLKKQFSLSRRASVSSLKCESAPNLIEMDNNTKDDDQVIVYELLMRAKDILAKRSKTEESIAVTEEGYENFDKRSAGDASDAESGTSLKSSGKTSRKSSKEMLNYFEDIGTASRSKFRSFPPFPVNRYCDTVNPNEPNPQIIRDVIQDLTCVFEKTFGTNVDLRTRFQSLESENQRLREELACCEQCKGELECEIMRIQSELQACRYALEEETQRRVSLETIVAQLREQLQRLNEQLDFEAGERNNLTGLLKESEMRLKNCANVISNLEAERNELIDNCRSFEQFRETTIRNVNVGESKCTELQEALSRCCQQNEEYQMEIAQLRLLKNEIDALKLQIEKLQYERNRMMSEFENERMAWVNEKSRLDQVILDLRKAMDCLEVQKQEICRKMTEVVSAHHAEMDKLKKEAENFKGLYECEKAGREILEKKLRDCEEQKQINFQQQQQQLQQHQEQFLNQLRMAASPPPKQTEFSSKSLDCDQYLEDLKTRLETANTKISGLDKDLQHTQMSFEEKAVALVKVQSELQQAQETQKCLEQEVIIAREQSTNIKAILEGVEGKNSQLQKELDDAIKSLQIRKSEEIVLNNNSLQNNDTNNVIEILKKEYGANIQKSNDEVMKMNAVYIKAQVEIAQAELSKQHSLQKCEYLTKLNQELEEKLQSLQPAISEAEFYKKEAKRIQTELKDREAKVTEFAKTLSLAEDNLKKAEKRILQFLEKDKNSVQQDSQMFKLRESMRQFEMEKVRLEEVNKNLEERIQFLQPRLEDALDQRKNLDEKLVLLNEENRRLQKTAVEERVTRDLFQRELKDAQGLWEAEVKAKGILAEQIANNERQNARTDSKTKQEISDIEKWKERTRQLRSELRSERELVAKLKHKVDQLKEHCRAVKDQLQEMSNDPRSQKLLIQLDQQKSEFEGQTTKLQSDRDNLMREIHRLRKLNTTQERELKQISEDLTLYQAEKATLQNLIKMKDRLELEVLSLKRAMSERYVEKTDVDRLKHAYEAKLSAMKGEYEQQAQVEINKKLAEVNQYLGKQSRDRSMIDHIRESNENTLRTELTNMSKSVKIDIEKLKAIIRERDEEIYSLRSSVTLLKDKYSVEAKQRQELVKKLHLLSSISQESLTGLNNNV